MTILHLMSFSIIHALSVLISVKNVKECIIENGNFVIDCTVYSFIPKLLKYFHPLFLGKSQRKIPTKLEIQPGKISDAKTQEIVKKPFISDKRHKKSIIVFNIAFKFPVS